MELVKGQKLSCGQKYGIKRSFTVNGKQLNDIHNGVDVIGNDTNLLAGADGKVLWCGTDSTGSNTIVTAHGGVLPYGFVLLVLYAHCKSFNKKKGDTVKKGEKVATMGMTGNATGVHLHCSMYALPPNVWKNKNGQYYTWSYANRDDYEIDPNELLKLY